MTAKNKAKIRAEKKRTVEGICYRVNYSRASGMPCGSNDLWFDVPFSVFRASWCPDSYGYSYCSLWEFETLLSTHDACFDVPFSVFRAWRKNA